MTRRTGRLPHDADLAGTIAAGYDRMANSSVCVCARARDCAPALQHNLPFIDRLCARFKRAHVVVVENDSTDGTKDALRTWAAGRPEITLFLEDFGTKTVPDAVPGGVNPSYSRHRIEKLASYRNRYLEHASALSGLDYLVVIDLDLFSIDIDGIADAFGQTIPWDAQFANGRISDPCRPELEDFFWDTYAVWELGDESPQTESKIASYWTKLSPLRPGMPLFAVQSAFGGLGIYRWPAVSGHRYGVQDNGDARVEAIGEHTYLHRSMSAGRHGRLFINPTMVVFYNRPRSRATLRVERLADIVRNEGLGGAARKIARRIVPANVPSSVK